MKKYLIFILCSFYIYAHADDVKGSVYTYDNKPLALANVVLFSEIDSSFIAGAMTDSLGNFKIRTAENRFILQVSSIGYETYSNLYTHHNIGKIILKEDTTMLHEVTIKGWRPSVRTELNKVTVNVSNSYLQYLGSLSEVLGRIPGLTSSLQLLGGGTPTFLVDGREVSEKELSLISPAVITKIVVDSNPTAEYSASKTGVVHITTKSMLANMLSSEISNTSIFARNYVDMVEWNLNEQYGKVSNLLSFKFGYITTTQIDNTTETIFLPQQTIESAKERTSHWRGREWNLFYSMKWDISKKQALWWQYTGNIANVHAKEPMHQTVNHVTTDYTYNNKEKAQLHSISAFYRYKFDPTRSLSFTTDYSYNHSHDAGFSDGNNATMTNNKEDYHIAGTKISYSSRRNWATVSTGIAFSKLKNNGKYGYNAYDESFDMRESVFSYYLHLTKQWKSITLQSGIRMEADKRKLTTETAHAFVDSTEWIAVPSLSISKTFSENSAIGFSIGQSIQRPAFKKLDPSLVYYDEISYSQGNPLLRPSVTTDFKLSYEIGDLSLSAAYKRISNGIIDLPIWSDVTVDKKNIKWTSMNIKKSSNFNVTAIYNFSAGPFQGTLTGAFEKPRVKVNYLEGELVLKKPIWYFSANAQYPVSKTSFFAIDGNYDSSGDNGLYQSADSWTVNMMYVQQLFKNNLTLYLAVNDIFHTDKSNKWVMEYNNVRATMDTNGDTRQLMVKLTYNIGKLKLDAEKKHASEEMLNRL